MYQTTPKQENRLQFRFWLDTVRPEEDELAVYVLELKHKRRFAQTIRDGLRLIRDLQAGRLLVLLSLFPWIEDYFRERFAPAPPPTHQDWLESQLNQLKTLLQQRDMPTSTPSLPMSPPRQQLSALSEPPSVELLEVQRPAKKPSNAGRILILQVWLASNLKNLELFSLADLELVTGHPAFNQALIQAELQRRRQASPPVTPPPALGVSKRIQGSEIDLPPPADLDDLMLL